MLDVGQTFFASQILDPLSDNSVYQSYLVSCDEIPSAKLLVFKKNCLARSKERRRLIQRVQQLAKQDYPDIAFPYRAGEEEGRLCCLYPLPSGQPLADLLAAPFSVRQSLELLARLAQTLSGPHRAGLFHGSLSPATIFPAEQRACLADFSLAELVRLNYQSGLDPHYVSPEQVRGDKLGPASDLYSLGAVAYRLFTGTPPFAGEDDFAIAKQHLQGTVLDLPEYLSCCRPVLHALTRSDGAERITAQQLHDELQMLLLGTEIDQLPKPEAVPEHADMTAKVEASAGPAAADEQDDIAARIEQRLQEHVGKLADVPEEAVSPAVAMSPGDEPSGSSTEEPHLGRYLLILLLGVALGSGTYFLFFQPSASPPASAPSPAPEASSIPVPEETAENPLVAELNRAVSLWHQGDPAAKEAFRRIKQNHSQDPRAYNNLAVIAAAQGDYEQARNLLELALMTDSDYATVYRNLGSVYAEMARDSYGKALQLEDGQSYLNLQALSGHGPVALAGTQDQTAASKLTAGTGGTASQSAVEAPPSDPPLLAIGAEDSGEIPQGTSAPGMKEQQSDSTTRQSLTQTQDELIKTATAAQSEDAGEKNREVFSPSLQQKPTVGIAEAEADPPAAASTSVDVGATATSENSVSPVPAPGTKPAETKPAAPLTVENFLMRWTQAWSDQDVEGYLRHYADNYDPVGGRSLEEWRQQRRERLSRPDRIRVKLEDMESVELADGRTQVTLIQSYTSDSYADKVRKIIDLQPLQDEWRIVRERSLGRVE